MQADSPAVGKACGLALCSRAETEIWAGKVFTVFCYKQTDRQKLRISDITPVNYRYSSVLFSLPTDPPDTTIARRRSGLCLGANGGFTSRWHASER